MVHIRHRCSGSLSLSVKTWSPYATSHRPRPPLPYSPGRMPYSGMGNAETREQVCKQGYRMPPPPGCPDQIGILLEECWRQDADDRPTMDMVLDHLDEVTSIFPDVLSTHTPTHQNIYKSPRTTNHFHVLLLSLFFLGLQVQLQRCKRSKQNAYTAVFNQPCSNRV